VALGAIATGSKDAMKVLVDATKKAVADQRNELKSLGREIDGLSSAYQRLSENAEKLKATGKGGETLGLAAGGVQQQLFERMRKAGEVQGGIQALEDLLRDFQGRAPEAPERRPFRERAMDAATVAAGVAQGMSRIAGSGAALAATVRGAADVNTGATLMTGNRILGELMRGDFRGLMQLSTPNGQRILERYGDPMAARLGLVQQGAAAAGQALAGGVSGAAAGSALGPGGTIGGAILGSASGLMNLGSVVYGGVKGGVPAAQAAQVEAALQQERQFAAAREFAMDSMMQHAGTRVHGAKALQGRHFNALGIGAGYGMGFDQSVSQAESILRSVGDVEATFGTRARFAQRAVKGTGGYSSYNPAVMQAYGQSIAAQVQQGMITPQQAAANIQAQFPAQPPTMQKVQTAASAPGYMKFTNDLMRMGWSQGAAAGSLTGLGEAAIMSKTLDEGKNAPQTAYRQLMEVFARGTEKGFTSDKTLSLFSEAIAKGMAESAFGVGGAVGGYSQRLESLTAGLGTNVLGREATMRDVQSAMQAQSAINQLTQQNPYMNMVQTAAGIKAIGPGGSGLAARALQMSSMQDLMGGNEFLTAAGVTKEQRMATMRDTAGGILGTFARGGKDMTLLERAAAINANTGVGMDVAKQMVGMLEFQRSGAFTKAKELSPAAIKSMQYGDFAESVAGLEAKGIFKALGMGEKELREFHKRAQKTGEYDKAFDELMQNRAMATGEFKAGNQYVVQVMSGPLKQGQTPKPAGAP